MVNILPNKQQRALYVRYYTQLFSTFFLVVAAAVMLGAVLLVPSYFLAQEEAKLLRQSADAQLQRLTLGGSTNEGQVMQTLEEAVSLLQTYEHDSVVTKAIVAVTAVTPSGVTLQKVRILTGDSGGSVTLSGTANTRAGLVEFVSELQRKSIFSNVSVPVSDLAAEEDLNFSLSFTLNPSTP